MSESGLNPSKILPPNLILKDSGNHLYQLGIATKSASGQPETLRHRLFRLLIASSFAILAVECFLAIVLLQIDSPISRQILMYLGDFSYSLPSVKYHWNVAILSFQVVQLCDQFHHANLTPKFGTFQWMKPFQMLAGMVKPFDVGLIDANYVMALVNRARMIFKFVDNNAKLLPNSVLLVVLYFTYQTRSNNLIQLLIAIPWCCLSWINPRFGGVGILTHLSYLHIVCYYLKLKLRQENQKLKQILIDKSHLSSIKQSLSSLFAVHAEIKQFNDEFWSQYCSTNCAVYLTIICALFYQVTFGKQLAIKLLMLYFCFLNVGVISNIWLSSASVAKEAIETNKRLYKLLFGRRLNFRLKVKVAGCIEKIANRDIGFYCLDIFMLTYTTYAKLIGLLAVHFLLVVELSK